MHHDDINNNKYLINTITLTSAATTALIPYCVAFLMVSGEGGVNWWLRESTKQWMTGVSCQQIITVFFCFFNTQLHAEILTNKKAALFGSSKLSGGTAPGLSLGTWGGSIVSPDAAPDVFISYGAPQDSLCTKREERTVILWFSHMRTTQKWMRTRHTRQIVSIHKMPAIARRH